MANWAKGKFTIHNAHKYVGNKAPTYRSSWEMAFMRFADNHPNVLYWSSEPIRIPYKNPLTGKQSHYVPDFLLVYADKNGKQYSELIEIKPAAQSPDHPGGKGARNKLAMIVNYAKWESARAWCKQNQIKFRVLTEHDIYAGTRNLSRKKKK